MTNIYQIQTGSNNVQIINGVKIKRTPVKYYRLETYESLMMPTYRSHLTNKLWWLKLKARYYYWTKKCPIAIVVYEDDIIVNYIWIREYSRNTELETENLQGLVGFEENRQDTVGEFEATVVAESRKIKLLSDHLDFHPHENLLDMSDDDFYDS